MDKKQRKERAKLNHASLDRLKVERDLAMHNLWNHYQELIARMKEQHRASIH